VIGDAGTRVLDHAQRMPGAAWYPEARLNFAQNLLERRSTDDNGDALVFWGEDKVRRRLVARTASRARVARFRRAHRARHCRG
jgi:acetoacetyl-CoA synthetase